MKKTCYVDYIEFNKYFIYTITVLKIKCENHSRLVVSSLYIGYILKYLCFKCRFDFHDVL